VNDNVVDFCKVKSDIDVSMSHHIVSLDLFINSGNSMPWAKVSNVDEAEIDADWHRFIAGQLRHLAWLADGMAADIDGSQAPIASVSIFEDRRISTRWNDDLVTSAEHLQWIRDQLQSGADEIEPHKD